MAVIETYVSKDPASHLIPRVLPLLSLLSFLACYKPPSSDPFLSKNSLQAVVPVTGFGAESRLSGFVVPAQKPPKYSSIVRKYADKYDLDWVLVLSVMKQESQFKPNARSRVGAYGLMQIMPVTESDLRSRLGVKDAKSPSNNIKVGTFHLRSLLKIFRNAPEDDRIRLSLAAYNAGLGRILDARQIVAYLGHDSNDWAEVRKALPLLSRRYYTLHQSVWDDGRPPSGYFVNWRQTTKYVEKVMNNYDEFALAFN